MKIYVDNFIWFYKNECSEKNIIESCKKAFTYSNPEFFVLMAMGQFYTKVPKNIYSFIENDTIFALPRGTGKYLTSLCKATGVEYQLVDRRVVKDKIDVRLRKQILDKGVLVPFDLRSDQKRALSELIPHQQGCLEAPCGAGKTVLLLGGIAEIQQPTIVLVHTVELLNQWVEQIQHKLEGDFTIGQLGGGKKEIGDITVSTIQTLYRYNPKELKKLASRFGLLMLDEAHHAPANSFSKVLNYFPAKYRFGATATPKRKDKLEFLMTDVLGKVVSRITDQELLQQKKITSAVATQIATSFKTELGVEQWVHVVSSIVTNQDRNQLIINKVLEDWNAGHFILVLSDRVEHCREMQKILQRNGMTVSLLIGDITKEEREKVRKKALSNKLDAIIGTTVADEGLDIPLLDAIHLTTPANNEGRIKQRCGRIRRVHKDKKLTPVIRDYVDVCVPFLAAIGRKRARWYTKWGFEVNEVQEPEQEL